MKIELSVPRPLRETGSVNCDAWKRPSEQTLQPLITLIRHLVQLDRVRQRRGIRDFVPDPLLATDKQFYPVRPIPIRFPVPWLGHPHLGLANSKIVVVETLFPLALHQQGVTQSLPGIPLLGVHLERLFSVSNRPVRLRSMNRDQGKVI